MSAADARLILVSQRQYGAFTRAQATSCGFSAKMIRRRLDIGEWRRLHPNVFAYAATPNCWQLEQMAACLWSRGPAAVLAAGHLYDLPGCEDPPVEIVTTRRRKMPMCGVVAHYTTRLPASQVTSRQNIPCTTIERTLLDLCGRLSRRRAAIALDRALQRQLTTLGSLDHCLYQTARRGRNGCAVLRDLMHERFELTEVPNSPLETIIWELLVASGLPLPTPQFEIRDDHGRFVARVDFAYPEQKIVIEGHSKTWHWGAQADSDDARRHNSIAKQGFHIVYVTWADATERGAATLQLVAELLNHAS